MVYEEGELCAITWVLRVVTGRGQGSWVAEEYNMIEVSHTDFLISSVAWDSTPATAQMPQPTQIIGMCEYRHLTRCSRRAFCSGSLKIHDGEIEPWAYTDPAVGNKWRHIAKGLRVYAFPIWLYCDDTSGNVSKRWNKHNSFLFSPAGLPQTFGHQEYNVHFLCTSNVAEPLEMLEGIAEQLE